MISVGTLLRRSRNHYMWDAETMHDRMIVHSEPDAVENCCCTVHRQDTDWYFMVLPLVYLETAWEPA